MLGYISREARNINSLMDQRIEALNEAPVSLPVFSTEKKVYTVSEMMDILGISQTTAYLLIGRKEFHTVRIGRHIRISKVSFDAWLDGQRKPANKKSSPKLDLNKEKIAGGR